MFVIAYVKCVTSSRRASPRFVWDTTVSDWFLAGLRGEQAAQARDRQLSLLKLVH